MREYGRIWVKEIPYSCIFYAVIKNDFIKFYGLMGSCSLKKNKVIAFYIIKIFDDKIR